MSEINLHNYEAYMLDHLEGKLSPEDTLALKAFAILHPELELNFEDELVSLETDAVTFNGKQNLKAGFNDELVIGYLENVLSADEKIIADELARNNEIFKSELAIYKKTIASAEETIVFENKAALKHEPKLIVVSWSATLRIAAAMVLIAGIWILLSNVFTTSGKIEPQMANSIKKETTVPVNKAEAENVTALKTSFDPIATHAAVKPIAKKNVSVEKIINSPVNELPVNEIVPEKELAINTDSLPKQNHTSYLDTNALKLANNNERTYQKLIIEEGRDDESTVVSAPQKKTLWSYAAKMLNKLNQKGIENVNGSEIDNELKFGAFSVSKK